MKFDLVNVKLENCETEEWMLHALQFVEAFVSPNRRSRYRHVLVERPEKARAALAHLEDDLDPQASQELFGSDGFPAALESRFGQKQGIFISPPCCGRSTASEAASLAAARALDAVFSLEPGHLCLVFSHEGGVWLCRQ